VSPGPAVIAQIAAGMWGRAEKEVEDRPRRYPRAPEMSVPVRPQEGLGRSVARTSGGRPAGLFALEGPPRSKRAPILVAPGGSLGPSGPGRGAGRGQPSTAARLAGIGAAVRIRAGYGMRHDIEKRSKSRLFQRFDA
jgi:hypothetical protein